MRLKLPGVEDLGMGMNPTDRAMVREAIEKVVENPYLCVTITPAQWAECETVPWVEVTARGMGLDWQSSEDPDKRLRELVGPLLPGLRIVSVLEHAAVSLFFDDLALPPVEDRTQWDRSVPCV